MTRLYDYKLRFKDEKEAEPILRMIPKRGAAYHVIGTHKELAAGQEYLLSDPDFNGELEYVTIEGWHVDVRSKTPLDFLEQFKVEPKKPFHSFFGGNNN